MTNYKTCPVDDCCGGTIIRDSGMRTKCRMCAGSGVIAVSQAVATQTPACDVSELEAERARCADLTTKLNRERELRLLAETRAQRDREMCEASSSDYIALRKANELLVHRVRSLIAVIDRDGGHTQEGETIEDSVTRAQSAVPEFFLRIATLEDQLDDAVKVANAESESSVIDLNKRIDTLQKKNKNKTKEIANLHKQIKTIEDYARLGVTTHFHRAVVKELDVAASVLNVERFHVAKWVKRAVERYAKCSNKECLFGTIRSHYDQDCIVHEERPCSVCNSNAIKFEQATCSYCEGSGWVARDEQCELCFGRGTRDTAPACNKPCGVGSPGLGCDLVVGHKGPCKG